MVAIQYRVQQLPAGVGVADGLVGGGDVMAQQAFVVGYEGLTDRPLKLPESTLACLACAIDQPEAGQVCDLVARYGFLNRPHQVAVADGEQAWQSYPGELLDDWIELCCDLNRAVMAWRMSLATSWPEWDSYFFEGAAPPSRAGGDDELADMTAGCWTIATQQVQQHVDRVAVVLRERGSGKLLALEPPDLRGFLWLELAQAMSTQARPVACDGCDAWFLVDHQTNRTDKRYCSDACRMRVYRRRKKQKAVA